MKKGFFNRSIEKLNNVYEKDLERRDPIYLDTIHNNVGISHSYIEIGNKVIFNFYAENQRQSSIVKDVIHKYNGKYFVSESKIL